MKIIPKVLWALRPIIEFIDKTFTVPFSVKKINGTHYYIWRDRITKGTVFITDTYGAGSNLLNPSDGNHGAIYFGFGLRTALSDLEARLIMQRDKSSSPESKRVINEKLKSIKGVIESKVKKGLPIRDDVPYVIEALGGGVTVHNLVKFLTTKDIVRAYKPLFTDGEGMSNAADRSLHYLGLKYDFGFEDEDAHMYCFEVVADAYEHSHPNVNLRKKEYKFPVFGKVHEVFLASTFTDDVDKWNCIINSKTEFPELYR